MEHLAPCEARKPDPLGARPKKRKLEKENKYLKEMAEKMKYEKNRLYNNNIRLVKELKELEK